MLLRLVVVVVCSVVAWFGCLLFSLVIYLGLLGLFTGFPCLLGFGVYWL